MNMSKGRRKKKQVAAKKEAITKIQSVVRGRQNREIFRQKKQKKQAAKLGK